MSVSDQLHTRKKRKALELLNQNRLAEAKAVYLSLLEKAQSDAEAWFMLGTVEGRMGNLNAAEQAMVNALNNDPSLAEACLGLGQVLELQGRHQDAVTCYLRAIYIKPRLAEAHAALGRLYLVMARYHNALDHLTSAINLGLSRPALMLDYADALRYADRQNEALAAYQQLNQALPQDAVVHCRLANLYFERSHLDEAQRHFREAIRLDANLVEARIGEINLLRYQGKLDEAVVLAKPLFDNMTEHLPAAIAYAKLCHVNGDCEVVIQRLEQLLASGTLSVQGAAVANFQLGDLYQTRREYEQAFPHYQRGNDLKKGGYDHAAADAVVDAIIEGYSEQRLALAARSGSDDARPVFIVGMPRSGSSLIEQILASHPHVYGAGELTDMADLLRESRKGRNGAELIRHEVERMNAKELAALAAKYSAHLDALSGGEKIITDKLPSNFLRVGFIALLFPNARIIHSRRDAMDTCLSCYCHDFAGYHPYSYDLEDLAHYYKNYQRLMAHWREASPLPMLELDYEALVADQAGETRRLLDFLGLDWDDRCLRFHDNDRVTVTASNAQVQQPIYRGALARWKKYEKFLGPLQRALA